MKKRILIFASTIVMCAVVQAQDGYMQLMQQDVRRLDHAVSVKDYQQLANDFLRIAEIKKTQWLPYYYAAFCDAKVGWLNQDNPENIETFAKKGNEEIIKAKSFLDTSKQKDELSEVYCVASMLNRAMVFINSSTYGIKYGPSASEFTMLAEKANPDNPRALYLAGWEKFSTPKMWGGDKTKAKQLLEKAEHILDKNNSTGIAPHWGKKEVEAILKQLK